MDCWGERVGYSWLQNFRALLSRSSRPDWTPAYYEDSIRARLHDGSVERYFCCPCNRCKIYRGGLAAPQYGQQPPSLWMQNVGVAKRLFAVCVIAERPYLIYPLLRNNVTDAHFDTYTTGESLRGIPGISGDDVVALMKWKEAFFEGGRINLFDYLRSGVTTEKRRPGIAERNWLMDELLVLMYKAALPPGSQTRQLRTDVTIGRITIRASPARGVTQITAFDSEFARRPLDVRSLGYLIYDVISYIAGGTYEVLRLDYRRPVDDSVEWVRGNGTREFDHDPYLRKALDYLWVMICPNELFSLNPNDFTSVRDHFQLIWENQGVQAVIDPALGPGAEVNSNSSGRVDNLHQGQFFECALHQEKYKWILARYGREGFNEPKKCRLRVMQTIDAQLIHIEKYKLDSDVQGPSFPQGAQTDVLRFIPLYAFNPAQGFTAKFQHILGPDIRSPIPHIFRFQTLEDVKTFQSTATNRIIEKDIYLTCFAMTAKNLSNRWSLHHRRTPYNAGRIQLWRVLDDDALRVTHERALMRRRGNNRTLYPIRFEIAIFSTNILVVLSVKSFLTLQKEPNNALSIYTEQTARVSRLEGRMIPFDEGTRQLPGLPLFQPSGVGVSGGDELGGNKVEVEKLELTFANERDREKLQSYLRSRYRAQEIQAQDWNY